jgi:hypothetical protein
MKLKVNVTPSATNWGARWSVSGTSERNAKEDEVVCGDEQGVSDWSFSRTLESYDGVLKGTYETLRRDFQELLQGNSALGTEDL